MADATRVFAEFGATLSRVAAIYAPPGADREDLVQEMRSLRDIQRELDATERSAS